jgi:uncharacterized repeat protein (TIGR01451 family)
MRMTFGCVHNTVNRCRELAARFRFLQSCATICLPLMAIGFCSCASTSKNSPRHSNPPANAAPAIPPPAPPTSAKFKWPKSLLHRRAQPITPESRELADVSSNTDSEIIVLVDASQAAQQIKLKPQSLTQTTGVTQVVGDSAIAVPAIAEPADAEPEIADPTIVNPSIYDLGFSATGASIDQFNLENHPDEYLLDGGNRGFPVHYDQYHRHGVETEDTIAEYTDDTGENHIKATNRVAIYAPRFGAVRSITVPDLGTSIKKIAFSQDAVLPSRLDNRVATNRYTLNQPAHDVRMRSRASAYASDAWQDNASQTVRLDIHETLLNAFEDSQFVQSGQFLKSEEARLSYALQAAANWTRDLNPVVAATTRESNEVYARFRPKELVGIEIDHKRIGELRIVKLADKKVAKPGDVITFTIRYDNLGDRPLHHIRIIDNLTPRLEFIEDSAESELAGDIITEDNGEGSLVLKFILENALPGKTGGAIKFQCRVR